MFQNLEISQKLYSLKSLITDNDDLLLIDKIIDKYKTEINVDFEFTNKELARMRSPISSVSRDAEEYVIDTYNYDVYENFSEEYYLEYTELFNKFKLTKLKIHREKNTTLRNVAKESFKIIMKEEFIKLLLKYKK